MLRKLLVSPSSWFDPSPSHVWQQGKIEVYSVSDLHTDHHTNQRNILTWQGQLEMDEDKEVIRILIIAGDISADLDIMQETLTILSNLFHHTIFVPGNNEFRLRKKNKCNNSLEKLEKIFKICADLGIHSPKDGLFRLPIPVSDSHHYTSLLIYPLLSWYHPSFECKSLQSDEELDKLGTDYQRGWLDFAKIRWPEGLDYRSISNYFLEENMKHIGEDWAPKTTDFIITVSHFLPRLELVPRVSKWMRPTLVYVVGSRELDEQIRELQSDVHVCGHTHIDHDTTIHYVTSNMLVDTHQNANNGGKAQENIFPKKLLNYK